MNRDEINQAILELEKGNWTNAHELAQNNEGNSFFDFMHAICHRLEGDQWNAGYWYRRCNKDIKRSTIEEDIQILKDML